MLASRRSRLSSHWVSRPRPRLARRRPIRASALLASPPPSGIGLNKVQEDNSNLKTRPTLEVGQVGGRSAAAAIGRKGGGAGDCGCGTWPQPRDNVAIARAAAPQQQGPAQPALFAWVMGGGKNLTPVRRCGLGGPHPRTTREWRQLCRRVGHSGISKHAEMAALAALPCLGEASRPQRRRLTLVVVRLCAPAPARGVGKKGASSASGSASGSFSCNSTTGGSSIGSSNGESSDEEEPLEAPSGVGLARLGLARPCDECTKVICAVGCFRRVVYSDEDGRLACAAPEDLLQRCTPSSGKRRQQTQKMLKRAEELAGSNPGPQSSNGVATKGSACVPPPPPPIRGTFRPVARGRRTRGR